MDNEAIMMMMLWVLGVWLLASVPVALFIGQLCSLNPLARDEEWLTSAPPADQETPTGVRAAAYPHSESIHQWNGRYARP